MQQKQLLTETGVSINTQVKPTVIYHSTTDVTWCHWDTCLWLYQETRAVPDLFCSNPTGAGFCRIL